VNALTASNETALGSELIADQQRPAQILTAFLQKETIPHALLFTGIEGVGKNRMATVFAMAANCGQTIAARGGAGLQPCGECRSCRKIERQLHPDIHRIRPDGRTIRIHQIRTLIETLSLKPMEARTRFVIVERADTMRPAAGNALLKTLEEPPDRTVLILLATQAAALLPTIVSRCRQVRFHPVSARSIARRLVTEHGISETDAALAAAAAGGSLTRAVAISESGWARWRNWLLEASGLDHPDRLPQKPLGELLAFAEQLTKNKDQVPEALETMTGWLRDLIVIRHDPGKVTHIDRSDSLQQVADRLSVGDLMTKIDIIREAQESIDANGNLRLTLEAMVLRLSQDCAKEERLVDH
jgi:DNA polymerase-3 subunit delta'